MSRDETEREIVRARERADLARLRFGNAVNGVLDRLTPDRLRAEAIEVATDQLALAKQDLMQRFKHAPLAFASLAAGIGALMLWKPARDAGRFAFRLASFAWATRGIWRREK